MTELECNGTKLGVWEGAWRCGGTSTVQRTSEQICCTCEKALSTRRSGLHDEAPSCSCSADWGETPEVLHERLASAIWSLRDEDASVLWDMFRLSDITGTAARLGEHRDILASRLGIGRDAVADRDAAAVERLLVQLITGWYSKSPGRYPESRSTQRFVYHAVTVTTYVWDRRHLESRHLYRLFALFDGMEYVAMTMSYPAPPALLSAAWTVTSREVSGGWEHRDSGTKNRYNAARPTTLPSALSTPTRRRNPS